MSKWIECDVDASTGKPYLWKCDECGEEVETRWNYCPECGDPKTSKGKNIETLIKAMEDEHRKLREMQKALPEIIYCKDCNHFYKDNLNQWCFLGKYGVKENGFCSRAERRTNERSD